MRTIRDGATNSANFQSIQSFTEIVKIDFLLLGPLLLFLGLISTDAYYRSFGLRFQFLAYPWNLIIFRGILTVVRFPPLWILIVLVIVVTQADRHLAKSAGFKYQGLRINLLYILSAIAICWMPYLGVHIGLAEATKDMRWNDTTLPKITKIINADSSQDRCIHCLLLLMDSSQIAYFEALNNGDIDVLPHTTIRARSTINSIETTR